MTCKTPLSGSSVALSGPPFPPFDGRLEAHFAIGDTTKDFVFTAERDTLIENIIARFVQALDAGTRVTLKATYCNTVLMRDVDEEAFDITTFHHALFRCAVAENKTLRITMTLSQAQVAALDARLDVTGVQGNGCCRGPNSCLAAPAAGPCCGNMGGGGDLVGEDYPPYSTTLEVTTDAAGDADVVYEAERDTLFTDLIVDMTGVVGGADGSLDAEYCNTLYLQGSSLQVWDAAVFNHGVFICGVAENKKLKFHIRGGGNAQIHRITLTGVQGNGCCR